MLRDEEFEQHLTAALATRPTIETVSGVRRSDWPKMTSLTGGNSVAVRFPMTQLICYRVYSVAVR